MGPLVVSALKLGATEPRRRLETVSCQPWLLDEVVASCGNCYGMTTYGSGRSTEPILTAILCLGDRTGDEREDFLIRVGIA